MMKTLQRLSSARPLAAMLLASLPSRTALAESSAAPTASCPEPCPSPSNSSPIPTDLSTLLNHAATAKTPHPCLSRQTSSPLSADFSPPDMQQLSDDVVPLTKELLREQYATFPNPTLSTELSTRRMAMSAMLQTLLEDMPDTAVVSDGEHIGERRRAVVQAILAEDVPTGLDSLMYAARCACEEAADRCGQTGALVDFAPRFVAIATVFETFQRRQRDHVSDVIRGFLPSDFRGSMFGIVKERRERGDQREVDELVRAGGSVREKFELLWEQQWRRRETLAKIGHAAGVWKWIMVYLGGVPDPLLRFARGINEPGGPTEALREKFGGVLGELARFGVVLDALCHAVAFCETGDGEVGERMVEIGGEIDACLGLYEIEARRFVALLQEVITGSPFFVQAKGGDAEEGMSVQEETAG